MLKNCIIIVLFSIFLSCVASKKAIKKEEKIVTGIINKKTLQQLPYSNWFTPKYERVSFDKEIITKIKEHSKGVKIKAAIGVWCGDSKREIPVFYKLLHEVGFEDENNLELIAVNHKKKAKELKKKDNIIRVPTFIFYVEGKEVGRFVEFPMESLEEDILKIISGKKYKHFYED